jgi:hypothetical protein
MARSITRLVLNVSAIVLIAAGVGPAVSVAQDQASTAPVIHSGNTDIVFENADMSDIRAANYRDFDQFAAENPEIVQALARNPRLITSENFAESRPALADFLRNHPDFATDFAKDPGNYVDMPLSVAASVKVNPIEQ